MEKATYPNLTHAAGYILIYRPEHPAANCHGYVLEHRCVMETEIGRVLQRNEIVHHINGDKKDNRIENLSLMDWHTHGSIESKKYWDARI